MMFGNLLLIIKFWLLKIIQLQLFISIVSLPILIYWGLPFSLASPLGNLIFTPVLSLFLLISSLIFFCELIGLPNIWLINLLDWLTQNWQWFLSIGSKEWLISFPIFSKILLILLPIVGLLILQNKRTNNLIGSCISFIVLIFGFSLFCKINNTIGEKDEQFYLDNKKFTIKIKDKKVSLIDQNEIFKSSKSFIEYNFIPSLIKKFGYADLQNLIIINPTKKSIINLEFILKQVKIEKIYLIFFNKNPNILKDIIKLQKTNDNIFIKHLKKSSLTNIIANLF